MGNPGRLRAPVEEGVAAPWAAVGACVLRTAAPPRLLQVSPGVGCPVATVAVADAVEDHPRLRLEDCRTDLLPELVSGDALKKGPTMRKCMDSERRRPRRPRRPK